MPDLRWDRNFALEQAGEDEEILAELLDLFRESTADDLARIKKAVAEQDPKSLGEAAHSIKGAAASLGIEAIQVITYAMEKAGKSGDLNEALKYLPELESLAGQLDKLK